MRLIILAAGAALALSACRNNDQTDNTQNIDENLTAQNIVSNDVTAIDAVTGDAANMAADVDVNFTNDQALDNGSQPQAAPSAPASRDRRPRRKRPRQRHRHKPPPTRFQTPPIERLPQA